MEKQSSQKSSQIKLEEVEILDKYINDDSIVFDVGANLGGWTLEVLKKKKDVNLHLFEASPYTYQLLLRNMASYIGAEGLSLNQVAVSSQESLQLFNFYTKRPSLSGIYRRNLKVEEKLQLGEPKSISVPTITLDSYCKMMDLKHVNFIKIDVEGAELDVIYGAKELLKRGQVDYIQFEYGGTYLDAKSTLKQVFEYLQKMKYLIFKIEPQKLDYQPKFAPELENYKYSNFLAVYERFRTKILGEKKQMLDLQALCKQYSIEPQGIIHVGAHEGKELKKYQEMKVEKVLFIEANPVVFERLNANIAKFPNAKAVNYAISNEKGTVNLRVTSNEQSSSILPLKRHQEIYRNVKETHQVAVQSITLDSLLEKLEAQPSEFNLLNVDIQGAELLAFKGATNLLKHIQAINTEVNYEELYKGCALIDEIDAFLEKHGFERVATTTPYHPSWGDAFYLKKPKVTMSTLGKNGRFGNQMFQYAFLKVYAKQYNLTVETPIWIGQYLFGHDDLPISQQLPEFKERRGRLEFSQSRILNLPTPLKNVDLWGYFQYHTSYYAQYKDYFRSLFKPLPEIETKLQKAVNLLRSKGKTVIGIHLRRIKYDYANFYTTPSDRYKEWLKEIWETLQEPVLFIASDDLDAVADDLDEYNPVTVKDLNVELPKANYYPDFYILTQCDVVAISNSTFSFVASMLNERAKFFCRPSLVSNKMIPFDPWDSYVLLIEKKENLPDSGYKARITTSDSLVVVKNDTVTISAKVQNLSDVTWQRSCVSRIVLAYRWLDNKENVVWEHDREGNFDRDLQPGEETEVSFKINAPSLEGQFILELDMLDEDIAWFKDKGSETAKVNVLVEPKAKVPRLEEKWQLKTPVAFLIYKRPDTAEKVFETIRKAKPPKLLVIADGPKADVAGEVEKCAATRAIIDKVDWDCEVITNYSETNLGCRQRVSSGLDWVFEQVEEAIILEEDCLPHPTFFRFCEELLERYRHDDRVMTISGTNLQFENQATEHSYYFSRYNHCWGWATWRRVWRFNDVNMERYREIQNTNWLKCLLQDKYLVERWSKVFQRSYSGEIDSWDYPFRFALWTNNGLSIIPKVNLVSNIGFREDALHTRNPNHKFSNIGTQAITYPLIHPDVIIRNTKADEFEDLEFHAPREPKQLAVLANIQPNFDTNIFAVKQHFLGKTVATDIQTSWQLKTPVVFLICKRPDTTEKVFAAIREAQPPKLFVIADGPKKDKPGEVEKCAATRSIIDNVDWDCEVITNYGEENWGVRRRISSGLDWVFEQVEEAIILEDDCVPHPTFFRFCEELLERYRHDDRIVMIGGTNRMFGHLYTQYSYYFSRYYCIWGWATWRRAWHLYDVNLEPWSELKDTNWLEYLLKDKHLAAYWSTKIFQKIYDGAVDTWDYQLKFAFWVHNGLSVVPNVNLVSNIGWGHPDATHTRNPNHKVANIPTEAMIYPLVHPTEITRNMKADKFEEIILCPTKASRRLELLQNLQPNFDINKFGFKAYFLGDYNEENKRYLQTESLGLKESILIVTSIAPGNTEKQKAAIQSWYDLGFEVVSLNIESEAKQLQPIYDNVDFCIVKHDGNDLYGKPYVYINDLLDYLSEYGATICGIINSDIHLRADNKFASFIFEQTQDSIVFASRLDVESLEATQGKIYQPGFDVFFFDKNLLKDFSRSELCIGVPCWDLWIPFIAVQKNWKLKYLKHTVAVHVDHDKNWSQENWFKAWLKFSEQEVPSADKIAEMWKSDRKNELREIIGKEIAPSIRKAIYDRAELISCKRYKIAHIINPVIASESSDLYIAQPITFTTMKTAQQQAEGKVDVTLYAAQYPEDRPIIPEGFVTTPDLDRSILDIAQFQIPRKLPLIKDILDRLYEAAPEADYLIYTNADIALQPHFYTEVAKIIEQGYDAFVINRRTIPETYKDISEIPQMYAEKGESHPGHDCFIFKRSLYEKFHLLNHVIGVGFCFRAILLNLLCNSQKFKLFRDLHLTFHIGNQETWKDKKLKDYLKHNSNEVQKLFGYYFNENLLPNHPLIDEKFSTFAKTLPPATPAVELPVDATAEDYYQLGQKLEKEKQLNQALKAYQKAIEVDPNHFFYHQSLANILRQLNQDDRAISTYQKAIEIDPNFCWSYYHLAHLLQKQGKIQEAISASQKALELYPNFKIYQNQLENLNQVLKCKSTNHQP